jgi:hypothetical protein
VALSGLLFGLLYETFVTGIVGIKKIAAAAAVAACANSCLWIGWQ